MLERTRQPDAESKCVLCNSVSDLAAAGRCRRPLGFHARVTRHAVRESDEFKVAKGTLRSCAALAACSRAAPRTDSIEENIVEMTGAKLRGEMTAARVPQQPPDMTHGPPPCVDMLGGRSVSVAGMASTLNLAFVISIAMLSSKRSVHAAVLPHVVDGRAVAPRQGAFHDL